MVRIAVMGGSLLGGAKNGGYGQVGEATNGGDSQVGGSLVVGAKNGGSLGSWCRCQGRKTVAVVPII